MTQTPQLHNFTTQPLEALAQQQPSQQQTAPESDLSATPETNPAAPPSKNPLKRKFTRIIAIIIILALGITLYFIWRTPASTNAPPVITQQNFSGTSSNSSGSTGMLSLDMSYPAFTVKVSKSRTGQVVNKVASQSSHGLRNELVKKDCWKSRGLTSSLILVYYGLDESVIERREG